MKKPSLSAQITELLFPYACEAYIAGKKGEDFPFANSSGHGISNTSGPYTRGMEYILNTAEASLLMIYIDGKNAAVKESGVAFCCPKEDTV